VPDEHESATPGVTITRKKGSQRSKISERAYKPDSSIAPASAGLTVSKGCSTVNSVNPVTCARITGTQWAHARSSES